MLNHPKGKLCEVHYYLEKKIQTDYVRAMHGPYPILLVDKSPSEEEEEKRVDWFSRDEEVG